MKKTTLPILISSAANYFAVIDFEETVSENRAIFPVCL